MIIERIQHATEKDLGIRIDQFRADCFFVEDYDIELNVSISSKYFKTKIAAQNYAERLAGYLDINQT